MPSTVLSIVEVHVGGYWMYLSDSTLDDLLHRVLERLLKCRTKVTATRGRSAELTGVLLHLSNPRARLSHTERKGTIFSGIGELLWYLSGSDSVDFIAHYIKQYEKESVDGKKVEGAYGPRLFSMRGVDQVDNVLKLLRKSPTSRRAVIQLFDAKDIVTRQIEIPCTCMFQFVLRRSRLHMMTFMRSNDAYLGLSHDIFAFTMFQEIIARSLGVEVGTYKHFVGSLHLYDDHRSSAQKYIDEGWQSTTRSMPAMPVGDPWKDIERVLRAEHAIRTDRPVGTLATGLDQYWKDIVILLQYYKYTKDGQRSKAKQIKATMSSSIYDEYIAKREIQSEFAKATATAKRRPDGVRSR